MLIRFPGSGPADVPVGQPDYAEMEADFAQDRIRLALAIYRTEVQGVRFDIGDAWHPTLDGRTCRLCLGRFALRGGAFEVRLPRSLGGTSEAMHVQCYLGAKDWLP